MDGACSIAINRTSIILDQLIDYIQSLGIAIVTASEGFSRRANRLEVNDAVLIDRKGNLAPSVNVYNVEAVNTTKLNVSPITNYPNGKITISPFSKAYITSNFGAFEFTTARTLTTDRSANQEVGYGKQYFSEYQTNTIWMRGWGVSGWNAWVKIYPTETQVFMDAVNSKTNNSSPNNFTMGKLTYTEMTNQHMTTSRFPTTCGSVLVTDAIL